MGSRAHRGSRFRVGKPGSGRTDEKALAVLKRVNQAAAFCDKVVGSDFNGFIGAESRSRLVKDGFFELHGSTEGAVGLVEFNQDIFSLDFLSVDQGHDFSFEVTYQISVFVIAGKMHSVQHAAIWQERHRVFHSFFNRVFGEQRTGRKQQDGGAEDQ